MAKNNKTKPEEFIDPEAVDRFRELVQGKINILDYLDNSNGNSSSALDTAYNLVGSDLRQHQAVHGNNNNNSQPPVTITVCLPPDMITQSTSHLYGAHNRVPQNGLPPQMQLHYGEHQMRLPDSPPETDSGAGSAGSPSGSEAAPYSPPNSTTYVANPNSVIQGPVGHRAALGQQQQHQQQQHVGQNNAMDYGQQQQQQQNGMILSVPELTNVVLEHMLPVQTPAHQREQLRTQMITNMQGPPDYYATQATGQQASPNGYAQYPPQLTAAPFATNGQQASASTPGIHNGSGLVAPPPAYGPGMGASGPSDVQLQIQQPGSQSSSLSRKRLKTENGSAYHMPQAQQQVKPEPSTICSISPPQASLSDDGYFGHEGGPNQQCIGFSDFQLPNWYKLYDVNRKELPPMNIKVVADKGFNLSVMDSAFINQKKNHFQVSVHIEVRDAPPPRFIRVPGDNGGFKMVQEFQLDFYGIKAEMPSSTIQIKQSQADRKPVGYEPVKLELPPSRVTKVTVARLHFSETTINNQRKNGRPNPDQKYFQLVVSLNAIVEGEKYTVSSYCSDKVIVRASNPGQFENSEPDVHWQRGLTPSSVYHSGPVGVGTDRPEGAMTVHGDVHVRGTLFAPSDRRLKQNIRSYDERQAFENMSQIRIVKYELKPEIAERFGVRQEYRERVGIIAQEVEELLPDAVRDDGDFLQVDENRIFYESAAAVKELCRLTNQMDMKIEEVAKVAKKATMLERKKRVEYLKRHESHRSATSLDSDMSKSCSLTSSSYTFPSSDFGTPTQKRRAEGNSDDKHRSRHKPCKHHYCSRRGGARGGSSEPTLCSNRIIQSTIIILVIVMALCLVAMASLYILDWHKRNNDSNRVLPSSSSTNSDYNGSSTSPSTPNATIDAFPGAVNPGLLVKEWIAQHIAKPGGSDIPVLHAGCAGTTKCQQYCCTEKKPEEPPIIDGVVNKENIDIGSDAKYTVDKLKVDLKRDKKPFLTTTTTRSTTTSTVVTTNAGTTTTKKELDITLLPKVTNGEEEMALLKAQVVPPPQESGSLPRRRLIRGLTKPTNNGYYSYSRGSPKPVNVRIFGTNISLTTDDYCQGCDGQRGSYVFLVPISRFMPLVPLEIEFVMDQTDQQVSLCNSTKINRCGDIVVQSNQKMEDIVAVVQRHTNVWELPVGLMVYSQYFFRVSYSTDACSLSQSDQGSAFEHYHFIFVRSEQCQ